MSRTMSEGTASLWQQHREAFERDCARAVELSHETLMRIVEDNKNTPYGKKYGFDQIKSVEDYQRIVPLSDYSFVEEYVQRMRQGEEHALSVYGVKDYAMTSGTTGTEKLIPVSTHAYDHCNPLMYYTSFSCVPDIEHDKALHMSVYRMEPPAREPAVIVSAGCFRDCYDRGTYQLEERYVGGTSLMFSKGIGEICYAKLWAALLEPGMTGIQAFFLYDILLFLRYFEEHWERVLTDMEKGSIPDDVDLSEKIRKVLLDMLPLPKERAELIRRECEKGFQGIAKRLWPRFHYVSGIGGATYRMQDIALRYYLGDIPFHYYLYGASECLIAIPMEMDKAEYVLTPEMGFFEFIPYGEDASDARPRRIEELETGRRYEMVLTNLSGLYRYRLKDIVEVRGFYKESPILAMCFRQNQAINIAGEKMDMETLALASQELGREYGISIHEFSTYDDTSLVPGRYQCFLEAHEIRSREDAERVLAAKAGADENGRQQLADILDGILKRLNDDYRDLRELGMIGPPSADIVPIGTHEACKLKFRGRHGQNKPLQYLADPDVIGYMKEHAFALER